MFPILVIITLDFETYPYKKDIPTIQKCWAPLDRSN